MAFDAHKNFAISTVATAPSPATSGTSLVVASGDGAKFPAVSFNAVVWPTATNPTTANAEIVRVTLISTDTFTITRTRESTSARTIVVGDQIAACLTAQSLTDIEGTFPVSIANGGTGATAAGATYQASPGNPTLWGSGTSTNYLMLGLAGSITPAKSGTIVIFAKADNGNTTSTSRGCQEQLRYGTGGAPSNQAAATGTAVGTVCASPNASQTAGTGGMNLAAIVTGLTVGTAYWIDIAHQAAGVAVPTLINYNLTVIEL